MPKERQLGVLNRDGHQLEPLNPMENREDVVSLLRAPQSANGPCPRPCSAHTNHTCPWASQGGLPFLPTGMHPVLHTAFPGCVPALTFLFNMAPLTPHSH